MVHKGDRGVLAQFETFTPSYTSSKNDAENYAAALEVEGGWGNHVELEKQATAIKHLDEEQQELLHKLLEWRIDKGRGILVLLANLTNDERVSGRCAINQLSLLMQRAMLRWTKVETGLGKLSPFVTEFSSFIF